MKIKQTLLTGTILTGVGGYKIAKDYIAGPKEQKTRTLIRNTSSLAIASAVVFSADNWILKYVKSETLQNFTHNISKKIFEQKYIQKTLSFINPKIRIKPLKLELLADIITNSIKTSSLLSLALFSGILAGYITDKILKKIKPEKIDIINNYEFDNQKFNKTFHKFSDNKVFETVANEKSRTFLLNAADVFGTTGVMNNPFDKPLVIVHGLEMANKEKNLKKIMEQSATGILSEVVIPTVVISAANLFTKNKKALIRIATIAGSFYVGNLLGEKVGKKLTKEV